MVAKKAGRNAEQLQGVPVSTTSPSNTQVLAYSSSTGKWTPTAGGMDESTAIALILGLGG